MAGRDADDAWALGVLQRLGRELREAAPEVMGAVVAKASKTDLGFGFHLPILTGEVIEKADDVLAEWTKDVLKKLAAEAAEGEAK